MLTLNRYLLGGSPSGTTTYLNTINQASTQCPSTKIVVGGYSQGAQILHNAAEKLTAAVTAKIAAGSSSPSSPPPHLILHKWEQKIYSRADDNFCVSGPFW